MQPQGLYVVIERDEDGMYVGEVPQLKACYSQGETIDELMANMREVVEMCLEEFEANPFISFNLSNQRSIQHFCILK